MTPPLIEHEVGDVLDSTGVEDTTGPGGSSGPTISFSRADGTTTVLHAEDLMVYLALLQTLLLLYVTLQEVSN